MKKVVVAAFVYWAVASLIACFLYPAVNWDMVTRYGPMADAFARGEWNLAFHPRFGVLFCSLAGALAWSTGLAGVYCCQILAFFFLAVSAVPTWWVMRRLFGERSAWIVVVLMWCVVDYLVPALDGYRESGRMLGVALCACAFAGASSWTMGIGLLVLSSIRMDAWAVSCVLLFGWCVYRCRTGDLRAVVLPFVGWFVGTMGMCCMTYAFTGYWLPASEYVRVFCQLGGLQ